MEVLYNFLLQCGNASCDFSGENVSTFKDHLVVCEESDVGSSYYTCAHCAKQFKHIPTLAEHIKVG